ncbi:S24 family peptidase [Streptococcus caballi]|uniref:S24 family peptidase n=1 Tax=Streptococcus caballi TaxID=439220 RepID=UPI0003805E3E|nr:S24 family peptidase [Streptococcus caballi]
MTTLAENIKHYRKLNKLTQKLLAEKLNIAPTAVSAWELGRNKPLMDNVEHMSKLFNIPKSKLLGDDFLELTKNNEDGTTLINFDPRQAILLSNYNQLNDQRKNSLLETSEQLLTEQREKATNISEKRAEYNTRKRISLSVPGKVSAGTGYWQEDDYDTMVSFYADDIPDESEYDTIAIVVGHSMEPKIKNGDFLFIKLKDQVDINKIGIFQVNGENYVKKLKDNHLESLNKDFDNIQLSEEDNIRTIGEVVDIYREG